MGEPQLYPGVAALGFNAWPESWNRSAGQPNSCFVPMHGGRGPDPASRSLPCRAPLAPKVWWATQVLVEQR